jgi:hypothetical protein
MKGKRRVLLSNLPIRKDQIHPINPYRPPSAPNAFKLINWKPVYDFIVAGHIMGKMNRELAELYDYTPTQISNILRSDRAQELIKTAHANIRASIKDDIEETVDKQVKIQNKIQAHIDKFLDKEHLAEGSPFKFMETIAKFHNAPKATPVIIPQTVNNNISQTNNNISIKPTDLNRMSRALELSAGAVEIPEVEITDAK